MKIRFKQNKKTLIILLVLVLLAVGAYFLLRPSKKAAIFHKKPTLVILKPVSAASIPVVIQTTGDLLPNQQVDLMPETGGYVKTISFQEGHHVNKGDILVQLDSREQQSKVAQAKAAYNLSVKNYARNRQLKRQYMISEQALEQLASQQEQDKAALETAEAVLNEMTLRAPFNGYVGEKKISVGQYVQPGTQVLTLTDIEHLKITYTVPAQYSQDLKINQEVTIKIPSFPNKTFTGKVSYIAPTINEDNQTITVHAIFKNTQGILRAGQFVSLTQTLKAKSNALFVPENAILGNAKGYYVLTTKGNKVISQLIEPGEHYQGKVVVLSGLKKGDKIITAGQHQVKVGETIRVMKPQAIRATA